jgi:hypothetical protein
MSGSANGPGISRRGFWSVGRFIGDKGTPVSERCPVNGKKKERRREEIDEKFPEIFLLDFFFLLFDGKA